MAVDQVVVQDEAGHGEQSSRPRTGSLPGRDEQERQRSHQPLTTYWAKLGFQPWQGRVLFLDLATTALAEALASLNPNDTG